MMDLVVNIVMAGLLAVTISYCWMLNRRIKILQDSKSELAQLLKHFDESTQRASESILALQSASKKIGESIQHRVDRANYLLDDLNFVIDKGSRLSEKLEANFAVSRARSRVEAPAAAETPAQPAPEPVPEPANGKEKTRASLEAMLEKVSARTKPAWPQAAPKEKEAQPPRSRSEQELLSLLRAGIKG